MFLQRKAEKKPDAFDRLTPYNDGFEEKLKNISGKRSEANPIDIENKGFFGKMSRTIPIEDKILDTLNKMKQTGSKELANIEIDHLINTCEKNPILLPEFTEDIIKYLKRILRYNHENVPPVTSNP